MSQAIVAAAAALLIALLDEWRARVRARTAREEREELREHLQTEARVTREAVTDYTASQPEGPDDPR